MQELEQVKVETKHLPERFFKLAKINPQVLALKSSHHLLERFKNFMLSILSFVGEA